MTRQIEKTLNLPSLEDALKQFSSPAVEVDLEVETATTKANNMTKTLESMSPAIVADENEEGTESHILEMDYVYTQAIKAHKEMLDLGMNVEMRHAGSIFEPAARFLEIAMNASKSKSEQKLKTLKLRLDREKIAFDIKQQMGVSTIDATETGGFIADRNDLLKDLVGKLRDSRVPKK